MKNSENKTHDPLAALRSNGGLGNDGYWCIVCGRYLPADEYGVIVHDDISHPEYMTFNEEEIPQ